MRSKILRTALLALPLAAAVAVVPYAVAESDDREAVGLRVLNYNIQAGRAEGEDPNVDPPNIPRTAEAIRAENPDIVTLQEVHQADGNDQVNQLAEELDMEVHFGPADAAATGGVAGNAILTKFDIVEVVNKPLPDDPDTGNVKRAMAGVKIDLGDGAFIRVFTTHLSPGHSAPVVAEREAQGRYCLDYLSHDGPLLFTGDFNERPEDAIHGWALEDGFADTGEEFASDPTHGDARIDFVYARGAAAVGGHVPDTDASDHKPVVIDLQV
ncbi:MAG: endonuclease/exonuclease/phosphatase family protein [Stackebrandtia sp.]